MFTTFLQNILYYNVAKKNHKDKHNVFLLQEIRKVPFPQP